MTSELSSLIQVKIYLFISSLYRCQFSSMIIVFMKIFQPDIVKIPYIYFHSKNYASEVLVSRAPVIDELIIGIQRMEDEQPQIKGYHTCASR